jgi:hypothetical protein
MSLGDGAAHRRLVLAAASLFPSALVDLAILLGFEWDKRMNVALIVSNANLLEWLLFGFTARVAAHARGRYRWLRRRWKKTLPRPRWIAKSLTALM